MQTQENFNQKENFELKTEKSYGCKFQPKDLIANISGAMIAIIIVVMLRVVLIVNDDNSRFDCNSETYSNADEKWIGYYKKADNYLKDFTLDKKFCYYIVLKIYKVNV